MDPQDGFRQDGGLYSFGSRPYVLLSLDKARISLPFSALYTTERDCPPICHRLCGSLTSKVVLAQILLILRQTAYVTPCGF